MNNIKMFIDIFATLIDTFILYTFFSSVLGESKLSKKSLTLVYVVYFVLTAAAILAFENPLMLSVTLLILIISVSFVYRRSAFVKFFASIIFIVMSILVEMLVGVLLAVITKESVEVITSNIFYYIEGVLLLKVSLLIFVKIIQYRKLSTYSKVSKRLFVPIFALPVSTILIIYVLSKYAYSSVNTIDVAWVAVSVVFLVSSNVLVFHLFEKQLEQDEETKKSFLVQQQLQYQTQYFKELSDKYKLSNKTVHDTKNQLFAISAAISENDFDVAKERIDEMCNSASGGENTIKTGNDALDALINTKYNDNKELNIKLNHYITMNTINKIDNIDLCIIIGNALDNAIEACSKIDESIEKEITLEIRQVNDALAIKMLNPTAEDIEKKNGKLVSKKKEKELHGFGMQSMEEIVNKYNGNLTYLQEDGVFSLKIYVQN